MEVVDDGRSGDSVNFWVFQLRGPVTTGEGHFLRRVDDHAALTDTRLRRCDDRADVLNNTSACQPVSRSASQSTIRSRRSRWILAS